jgi:hypothetical protein
MPTDADRAYILRDWRNRVLANEGGPGYRTEAQAEADLRASLARTTDDYRREALAQQERARRDDLMAEYGRIALDPFRDDASNARLSDLALRLADFKVPPLTATPRAKP